ELRHQSNVPGYGEDDVSVHLRVPMKADPEDGAASSPPQQDVPGVECRPFRTVLPGRPVAVHFRGTGDLSSRRKELGTRGISPQVQMTRLGIRSFGKADVSGRRGPEQAGQHALVAGCIAIPAEGDEFG